MSWALGYDGNWKRWIGYGVPAYCDYPGCKEVIDRGLAYVCCNQQPYGGENGCGLYFCSEHANHEHKCSRCENGKEAFKPKSEYPKWLRHILKDNSWSEWRKENPDEVKRYKQMLDLNHKEK
jgi:hypothetical protein